MAVIMCLSVQSEVSIPHLRRYISLISSVWNSFSGKFVMMFSYVVASDEKAQNAQGYLIFSVPFSREIVKCNLLVDVLILVCHPGCRYFFFEWLLVRCLVTLMSNDFWGGGHRQGAASFLRRLPGQQKRHRSQWHAQRHCHGNLCR